MRSLQVMSLGLIVLLTSCASKHIPFPDAVYGVDIQKVIKNANGDFIPVNLEETNYDGMYFSKDYLNDYLQYKCTDEDRC